MPMLSEATYVLLFLFYSLYVQTALSLKPSHTVYSYTATEEDDTFRVNCSEVYTVVLITQAVYTASAAAHTSAVSIDPASCVYTTNSDVTDSTNDDVTDWLSSRCSGRRQCEVNLTDITKLAGCTNHQLTVSYKCVNLSHDCSSCRTCTDDDTIHIYLSHNITSYLLLSHASHPISPHAAADGAAAADAVDVRNEGEDGCTSRWMIHVVAGQQINISLVDITPWSSQQMSARTQRLHQLLYNTTNNTKSGSDSKGTAGAVSAACVEYVVISEKARGDMTVCHDMYMSRRHVYTSISHEVIVMKKSSTTQQLLEFSAVGCADITAPVYSVMRRSGDMVVIQCSADHQSWTIRCMRGLWVGLDKIGTCTPEVHAFAPLDVFSSRREVAPNQSAHDQESRGFFSTLANLHLYKSILVTLVICIALIIIVLIVTNGLFFWKKRAYDEAHRPVVRRTPGGVYGLACSEFEFQPDFDGAGVCLMSKHSTNSLPCSRSRTQNERPLPTLPRSHMDDNTDCQTLPVLFTLPRDPRTFNTTGRIVQPSSSYPNILETCGGMNSACLQLAPAQACMHSLRYGTGVPHPHCPTTDTHQRAYPGPYPGVHPGPYIGPPLASYPVGYPTSRTAQHNVSAQAAPLGSAAVLYHETRTPVRPSLPRRRPLVTQDDNMYFILDAEAAAAEPRAHAVDPLLQPDNPHNNTSPDSPYHDPSPVSNLYNTYGFTSLTERELLQQHMDPHATRLDASNPTHNYSDLTDCLVHEGMTERSNANIEARESRPTPNNQDEGGISRVHVGST